MLYLTAFINPPCVNMGLVQHYQRDTLFTSHSPSDSELNYDHAYLNGRAVARPSRPGNPLKYPHALSSPMPIERPIVVSSQQVKQPELREGELLQLFDETLGNCDAIRTLGDNIQGRIEGTQPGPLKLMGSPVLDRRLMFKHASPDAMVVHSITKPQTVTFDPPVRFQPKAPGFWPRQSASAFSHMDTADDQ